MICYTPCENCSYMYACLYAFGNYTLNPYEADVCIDDHVMFFYRFGVLPEEVRPTCVLWGDSVYDPLYYLREGPPPWRTKKGIHEVQYHPLWVASRWNAERLEKAGVKVDRVVYRVVRPVPVRVEKKDLLFVTLGENRFFDRKNIALIDEVTRETGTRDKTVIVSNTKGDIRTFTLTEEEKYRLYARAKFFLALSKSEGVGLPPYEAMHVGTVPIYVNAHGYKEYLRGIPIDPYDEYTYCTPEGRCFRVWEVKKQDVLYEIEHAKTMPKDEYDDIVQSILEYLKSNRAQGSAHRASG